jgi:hypothetical protein
MTTLHVRSLFSGWEAVTVMGMKESSSTDTARLSAVGPSSLPTPPPTPSQFINRSGRMKSISGSDFLMTRLVLKIDIAF